MKKRLWNLLLCLVLVCSALAGCGDKETLNDDKGGSSSNSEKPEKVVSSQFKEFADKITDALKETKESTGAGTNSGVDLELSLELGKGMQDSYGLEGLDKLGLILNMDMKNSIEMRLAGKLKMNDKNVVGMELITDTESAYFNLPDYSSGYAGISFQELLGMTSGELSGLMSEASEGMPAVDDIIELWSDFSNDFIDCFEYQEKVENISIGEGDYKIKADKYVTRADSEEVQKVFDRLYDSLRKFPALELDRTDFDVSAIDEMTVNYFKNAGGEFAWKLDARANKSTASIVLISSKKGVRFYVIDEDETEQVLLYSVKETEQKGQIIICTDDENIVVDYNNYSKDHVELSTEIDDAVITATIDSKNDDLTINFSITAMGAKVSGTLETGYRQVKLTASVSMAGVDLGKFTLESRARSFKEYSIPSNSMDMESWAMGLNQDKLMKDLQKLMKDFPFLKEFLPELF